MGTEDAPRTHAEVLSSSLGFSRLGLRFADPATEADYREWHIDEAIPFTRIGMQTSVFGWIAGTVVFGQTIDGFYDRAGPLAFGLVVPLILATIVATWIPGLRRWVLPMTAVTNASSGLVAAWAVAEAAGHAEASAVVILIAYFGFVVFRQHPLPALVAVLTYAVFHQYLSTSAWRDAELSTVGFVVGTTLAAIAVATGAVVCALLDRLTREDYRRERIIVAQREELAELNETLEARVDEQLAEIQRSRQRIVTAQDSERRRLERDLHDGAQQQLVALKLRLALAAAAVEESAPDVARQLHDLEGATSEAIEALRELAHGIYPPLLGSAGIVRALRQQASRLPMPVEVEPDDLPRFGADVEAAVYFCCLEALQNVAKHAGASHASVAFAAGNGLTFTVTDDGSGFDPSSTANGHGLTNLADRVAALGGTLDISSSPGEGTTVRGWVPTG
ncbi:MAG TPA: sensor histidine kinase [Acidimicrobiales bacterium]